MSLAGFGAPRRVVCLTKEATETLAALTPSGGTVLFQWVCTPRARAIHQALAHRGILTRLFSDPLSLRFGLPGNEAAWRRLEAGLTKLCVPAPRKTMP